MYLLGASVIGQDSDLIVDKMEALKPADAKKVHWREMSVRARTNSLELLGGLTHSTTIIVGTPLNGRKQERARRKCLELLLVQLEANNIKTIILESRGKTADKKDIDFLLYLRRTDVIHTIDLQHASGKNDARLYIPDQILGAYGDIIAEKDDALVLKGAWKKVAESVTVIELAL